MIHVFIVNPQAGKKNFTTNLREKLAQKEGFDYFVFNTRGEGSESELVKMIETMFDDEQIRYYCCGGSGTLRNVLNGITNLDRSEIAFYPCGLTNDFLKVFANEEERFADIDELISGDVVDIDYIQTNNGVCLNTVSFGIDTKMSKLYKKMKILSVMGDSIPYSLSIVGALFAEGSAEYIIETERGVVTRSSNECIFGNGFVAGGNLFFNREAYVCDGVGFLRICSAKTLIKRISIFLALMDRGNKKINEISQSWYTRFINIRRVDGAPFVVNQDGELTDEMEQWTAEIVQGGLHFVVPKGVKPV